MNFNISIKAAEVEVEVNWVDRMIAQADDVVAFERNCSNLMVPYSGMKYDGVVDQLAALNAIVHRAPAYRGVLEKALEISVKRFPEKKDWLKKIASCI